MDQNDPVDGFGRNMKTEIGDAGGTKSTVDKSKHAPLVSGPDECAGV